MATSSSIPVQLPPLTEETDLRQYLSALGYKELRDIRVIEKLLSQGTLKLQDLPSVLVSSKEKEQGLAQTAVEMKLTTESEVLDIRAELYDMEPVKLREADPQEGLARLLTAEQALEWRVLPYSRNDLGELLVAISEPENVTAREKMQKALPREHVVFHLAGAGELASYIEQTYNLGIEKLASELEASASATEEDLVVRDVAIEAPVIRLVDNVITQAQEQRASDIHIEPRHHETLIRFRVDGNLRDHTTVEKRLTAQIVARIKTLATMRTDERRVPQDGRVTLEINKNPLDLRVVTVPTIYGEQVTMRLLDPTQAMLTLEELGMSAVNLERYNGSINKAHGVALITGPTGSGKSTTLYSSLRRIINPEKKVISIEDPVEYRLEGITQIDVAGSGLVKGEKENKLTFANALRSILRSDPDIVMVGEIRDKETAEIAIDASLTGHFLYSTLHTNDALSAVTRLSQLKINPFLVAEAVEVIVSQRLTRCLCEHCKQPYEVDIDLLVAAHAPDKAIEWARNNGGKKTMYKANPEGCKDCIGIGYYSRIGVHEVVTITNELRQAIVEGAKHHELEKIARSQGMASLYEDAFIKAWQGTTSLEEINRVVA